MTGGPTAGGGASWTTGSLVAEARERLRSGATPALVCGQLAEGTLRWWDAASAVGRALGIPEPELRRRLHAAPEQVRGGLRPGEEQVYGELLGTIGVFDLPRRLDARERAIAEHLRAAVRAGGGRPTAYWAALVAGGELLDTANGDTHGGVAPALAECRRRRADRVRQSGPPPSGVGPPGQAAGPDA
ncbi:hypothetical protein ABT093_20285 [Kitasatospora sp. NPDC002551]|uniref:hypothetical protein n=1 Tax=Kitasatospora sp. NPDC002551 TaxID=3154539 RepID=UPI00331CD1D5